MAQLQCIIVTPESTVRDTPADFVALPLFDGEIGIAPEHSPLIGRLGFGELRVQQGDQVARYYVEGGFVEVFNNVVSVLTGRAMAADKLDPNEARQQLAAALSKKARAPAELDARDRALAQSRAKLRMSHSVSDLQNQ